MDGWLPDSYMKEKYISISFEPLLFGGWYLIIEPNPTHILQLYLYLMFSVKGA